MKKVKLSISLLEEKKKFEKLAEKYVPSTTDRELFMNEVYDIVDALIDKALKEYSKKLIEENLIAKDIIFTRPNEEENEERYYPKDYKELFSKFRELQNFLSIFGEFVTIENFDLTKESEYIAKIADKLSDPKGLTIKEIEDMLKEFKERTEKLKLETLSDIEKSPLSNVSFIQDFIKFMIKGITNGDRI